MISGWSGKFSGQPGIFSDIFQMVWKVSEQPGKFPDSLESFWIPVKFPDSLESFRIAWKVSGQSGQFLVGLESFWVAWKMIHTHFFVQIQLTRTFLSKYNKRTLFCCKNDLCTLFLWQKRSTRFFCRENDLRTSSRKFLRVESCHLESSDFLGLWGYVQITSGSPQRSLPSSSTPKQAKPHLQGDVNCSILPSGMGGNGEFERKFDKN